MMNPARLLRQLKPISNGYQQPSGVQLPHLTKSLLLLSSEFPMAASDVSRIRGLGFDFKVLIGFSSYKGMHSFSTCFKPLTGFPSFGFSLNSRAITLVVPMIPTTKEDTDLADDVPFTYCTMVSSQRSRLPLARLSDINLSSFLSLVSAGDGFAGFEEVTFPLIPSGNPRNGLQSFSFNFDTNTGQSTTLERAHNKLYLVIFSTLTNLKHLLHLFKPAFQSDYTSDPAERGGFLPPVFADPDPPILFESALVFSYSSIALATRFSTILLNIFRS
ncbi:hypothetical protein Tco_1125454 [Tanacetum coccineum]|uniref:Uncharacterized protein n=1 Tax=Tanacetum coccineum TaxID=301880 RepID=A0ABQ5J905_9ASTR